MQLKITFSALLAGLLATYSFQDVQAVPLANRNTGMVTLPLRRVEPQNNNIDPSVRLQQHINRGQRRLARMTGRAEPSDKELRANIHKRLLALEEADSLSKRYNKQGTNTAGRKPGKLVGPALGANANKASVLKSNATGNIGLQINQGGKNGQNAQGGQATRKGKAGTVGAGTAAAGAGGAGAAAAGASSANPGVSSIQLAAAADNSVTAAGPPTADNSLGLDIEANDVGYIATIEMGTPPQKFLLLMDSGSADLWVGAENCVSEAGGGCGNHNFLGPQSSNTFVDTKKPFQVTYGTGNVQGDIVQDNINVAGLALDNHVFGVATTESVDFSDNSTPFDGIMGLAQSTLSQQQTLTPIEALAKQGLVKDAITSYKISRLADQKNDGEITFGGLDNTKFSAKTLVTLNNVNQQGFWEASMPAVTVNGQNTGLQGRTAILDTGTTLIIAPADDALAVHKLIPGATSDGQGGFTVPCTTTASVALTFGKTSFAIDPRDLAFAPVDPNDPTGDCVSGISSGNIGGATEWLVGDVFLKNAYFSTDVTRNTLSLAKLV